MYNNYKHLHAKRTRAFAVSGSEVVSNARLHTERMVRFSDVNESVSIGTNAWSTLAYTVTFIVRPTVFINCRHIHSRTDGGLQEHFLRLELISAKRQQY